MKFQISRENLVKPLMTVTLAINRRQTLPILACSLISLKEGRLTLISTDMEFEMTAFTDQITNYEDGECTVQSRKFMDICKSLPENSILSVSIEDQKMKITSGSSHFALATLPVEDFPSIEKSTETKEYKISRAQLKHIVEKTHFCMANQDVRYYLNGLLLELNRKGLRAVATDGHRMALCDVACELEHEERTQIILPRKGIIEMLRLLTESDEPCSLNVGDNHVRINLGEITLSSRLIDGNFPDYEKVIPRRGEKVVVANREILRQSLQRAAILSHERYRGVRLTFTENLLRATVNNPEQEEAIEEIEVNYSGEKIEIGFNVIYLVEALNAIHQEEVEISLNDTNSSCLILGRENGSSRYVVMPMHL